MRATRQTSWDLRRSRRYCAGCGTEDVNEHHRCAHPHLVRPMPTLVELVEDIAPDIKTAIREHLARTYIPGVDEEII